MLGAYWQEGLRPKIPAGLQGAALLASLQGAIQEGAGGDVVLQQMLQDLEGGDERVQGLLGTGSQVSRPNMTL